MQEVSDWVARWAHLIRPGGSVLDLACGSGRHLRWLAARGFAVTGVDRDAEALAPLAGLAEIVVADLESGPWPLPGRRFDAVIVTNYLWRPLAPHLRDSLAEGALYLHETFADGNEALGRPRRPEFLLRRGELLEIAAGLGVVAYEEGRLEAPARIVQRIAAQLGAAAAPALRGGAGPGG
ncbi:MAG: class I SAM-dependent methyltransferase [Burkholderiales bacterium]|nr:class I SAM-dependent methyltransferase [Burkholderiales bacterium]MDE2456841.1 class I SAM-dependent methyltransferase [Burkholderiales bacterium]